MEIESLHKYINLNKLANGTTEVMFAGQPCLTITETKFNIAWKINPVFAKLVYGANIFEDIPVCTEDYSSTEEAVAGGLVKLHELGAFTTEVDFPEDTYAATMNQVQEEVKQYSIKNTKNIMEASLLSTKIMKSIHEDKFDKYNKFVRPEVSVDIVPEVAQIIEEKSAPVTGVFKTWLEAKLNEQFNSDDYYLVDTNTKKVVRNLGQKRISQSFNSSPHKAPELAQYIEKAGHTVMSGMQLNKHGYTNESIVEGADEDHEKWKSDVQKAHPGVKMKFKGYIEDGKDNISAEDEKGRTHGVWDNDKNKGHIFKLEEDVIDEKTLTDAELTKREEIVKALKKDPKFQTKRGKDSAYAIATSKAKEVA